MGARLAGVSRTIAGGAQTVPVPDGAGWQGAKALKVPDTIPLMPLAPHAPRINPVGNVRACLRASRRAICVSETCGDIVARCCDAWNFFAKDITILRSTPARDDAKAVKVQGRWYETKERPPGHRTALARHGPESGGHDLKSARFGLRDLDMSGQKPRNRHGIP
jgi:hypothetical protein